MKRKLLVSLMIIFALGFSGSQVFAEEVSKPVQVYVDGDLIPFTVNPLLEEGTTLVQFRPVFEKLGLKVTWDGTTQTVTGTTYNLKIQLTIGSKSVLVNGEEKQLLAAPKIVNDVTLIPLRFVGETSGREVSWEGHTKTVFIANTEAQIYNVIKRNVNYSQNEDLDGFFSTMDSSTPNLAQAKAAIQQVFAAYDMKYELEKMEIVSVDKDKAVVKVIQVTKKVKGPEFKDYKMHQIINLVKVGGEWKLTTSIILKIDYMNEELFKEGKVTISEETQKNVLMTVEKFRATSEKEDIDALKSMYDKDYPNLENILMGMKQLLAAFDFKFTFENIKIIQGTDTEVKVRYTTTIQKISGPEFPTMKMDSVETLKKNKDGEWKGFKTDGITIEYIR